MKQVFDNLGTFCDTSEQLCCIELALYNHNRLTYKAKATISLLKLKAVQKWLLMVTGQ